MTFAYIDKIRDCRDIATTAYYLAVRNRIGTTGFYIAYIANINYYLCYKDDLYNGFDIKTL